MGEEQPGKWRTPGLSTLAFEHPAQQIAFHDYVDAVTDAERRLKRVEEQIGALLSEQYENWN